jgi:hypothetical protein
MLSLTVGLIGVFSPIGAVVLLVIGLIPLVTLGAITWAIFFTIAAMGGIVIHYIKKE